MLICAMDFVSMSVRLWVGRLGRQPVDLRVEEERRMQILLRDNNVDRATPAIKGWSLRVGLGN